jgi:hypothetical protein
MAFDTNLAVRIATVLDNTGLKNADKGMKGLEKRAKSLGRTLGITLSTAAVVAYGKASVKAFMQDEAAATRLASAVKNLGLAFEQPAIDSYIQKLEASSAIADDSLRPALQALLTTTGSLAESQKILGIALDVSRGSGRELTQVTQDLAQAYVGNTRGLRKYNLGLTQAELKTMSFAEVQARLTKQFSGSNAAYLDTYAGKLSVLAVAAGNAQEVIGKGLVDALVLAGGKDADVQDVADAMQSLSTYTSDVIRGVGVLAGKLNNLSQKTGGFGLKDFVILIPILGGYISALEKAGRESRPMGRANRNVTGRSNLTLFDADAAKAKKLEADRLKVVKAQEALLKKQTAELKRQALTKKQSALFDIEQIQLIAALQGKLTADEQLRVKLQLALLTGNTAEADKLSQKLAMSINATGLLAESLRTLPDAKNPFESWDKWLATFTKNLATVTGSTIPTTGGGVSPAPVTSVPSSNAMPANAFNTLGSVNASTRTADEARRLYGGMGSSQPIVIQIDGKEIASVVQNQGLQGNNPIINRLGSFS